MDFKTHWTQIYETKPADQVSWYQDHPELSLALIQRTGAAHSAALIDVGGGASKLVDVLLDEGYHNPTVLDISAPALKIAQARLGERANRVTWLEADITRAELPQQTYDVWHDRAVFHFLQAAEDRAKYVANVVRSVKPGGYVIISTFAPDGPTHCSGLEVVRYSADALHAEFGAGFELVDSTRETHHTPFATQQQFTYCYCRVVETVQPG